MVGAGAQCPLRRAPPAALGESRWSSQAPVFVQPGQSVPPTGSLSAARLKDGPCGSPRFVPREREGTGKPEPHLPGEQEEPQVWARAGHEGRLSVLLRPHSSARPAGLLCPLLPGEAQRDVCGVEGPAPGV